MTQKYRLTKDRLGHKAGTIIYPCKSYDYGLSADDAAATGVEHRSMSPDGNIPFFTVPITDMEEVPDEEVV